MKETHEQTDHRLAQELGAAHIRGDISLAIKIEQVLNNHRKSSGNLEEKEDRASVGVFPKSESPPILPREESSFHSSEDLSSSIVETRPLSLEKGGS